MEYHKGEYSTGKELVFMSKHLNPLEKEFLIRQYKSNTRIKMRDFCEANRIENERLKKNYVVQTTDTGEQEFIRLRPKNSKS